MATARPSRTLTRRRCTTRVGRVRAGPRFGVRGAQGPQAGPVAQFRRRWVPTGKARASERNTRCHRDPGPEGQSAPLGDSQTPSRMQKTSHPPEKECGRVYLHTLRGTSGHSHTLGQGDFLQGDFQDFIGIKANVGIPQDPTFVPIRISTDSHWLGCRLQILLTGLSGNYWQSELASVIKSIFGCVAT